MDRRFVWKDDEEMTLARTRNQADREAYIQAMWLRFLFAPSKPTPELDGFYNLGEIGSDAAKDWTRATPYSPTERS